MSTPKIVITSASVTSAAASPTVGTKDAGAETDEDCVFTFAGEQYIQIPRPVQDSFTIGCAFKTSDPNHQSTPGWEDDNVSAYTRPEEEMPWYKGCGLVDCEVPGEVDDFGLSFRDGRVMFGIGNPDTTVHSQDGLDDGQWHTVWATRDQATGNFELYVDGKPCGTKNNENLRSLIAPSSMTIGSENKLSPGRSFKGQMRNIAIYDSVVPQAIVVFQLQAALNEAGEVVVTSSHLDGNVATKVLASQTDIAEMLRAKLMAVPRPGIVERFVLPDGSLLLEAPETAALAEVFPLGPDMSQSKLPES